MNRASCQNLEFFGLIKNLQGSMEHLWFWKGKNIGNLAKKNVKPTEKNSVLDIAIKDYPFLVKRKKIRKA